MKTQLFLNDCLDEMQSIQDCSVDSIITDPPYGMIFMGQKWDYDVPSVEVWVECLRVLKPGGHLLAFAGTRTQHRMAVRIEDAGFEIRDMIAWVYGSGFPKSKNLGDGWGSALKPALEPITVARKPFSGTLEKNWTEYSTGAINVDGCRVATTSAEDAAQFENNHRVTERLPKNYDGESLGLHGGGWKQRVGEAIIPPGRWPANLIHDGSEEVLAVFPEAKGQQGRARTDGGEQGNNTFGALKHVTKRPDPRGDTGSAARFFYCAKASKKDREEGLDSFEKLSVGLVSNTSGQHITRRDEGYQVAPRANNHPTVKPTDLMRYLCRLVTPPGGVVLDPFMGSGSTGKAAIKEGFNFIGIEMNADYFAIAKARIEDAERIK